MNEEDMDLNEEILEDENLSENSMHAKADPEADDRRKVEAKLEELRMQRLTQDYDFG